MLETNFSCKKGSGHIPTHNGPITNNRLHYSNFDSRNGYSLKSSSSFRREPPAPSILSREPHYIDIERNKSGHFYLLGKQIDKTFNQCFLDPRFAGASTKTGIPVSTTQDAIHQFLKNVSRSKGAIIAYSNAELDIFREVLDVSGNSSFTDIPYINLLTAAKKWIKKYKRPEFESLPPFRKNLDAFRQKRIRYSLASVMRLTNFRAPADYAPGKTTSRFNTVGLALEKRHQNFSQLTGVQKAKMTKVLKHNLFDVKAMPILFELIRETDPNCFKKAIKPLT